MYICPALLLSVSHQIFHNSFVHLVELTGAFGSNALSNVETIWVIIYIDFFFIFPFTSIKELHLNQKCLDPILKVLKDVLTLISFFNFTLFYTFTKSK